MIISSIIKFWKSKTFLIWTIIKSLDSSRCPLSMHVVCLYILTNCEPWDALEGNNKGLFLKEELPPQEVTKTRFLHNPQCTPAERLFISTGTHITSYNFDVMKKMVTVTWSVSLMRGLMGLHLVDTAHARLSYFHAPHWICLHRLQY